MPYELIVTCWTFPIQCPRPIRFRRGPFFCWWLDQGSLEEAHCCLTTKYYSVLQGTAPCYSVLQVIYLIVCRNTWNIIYIWRSNLWGAKHNGTMTFIFDSRNSWNVSYIAQSNLWDAKLQNTMERCNIIFHSRNTWDVNGIARSSMSHPPTSPNILHVPRKTKLRKKRLQNIIMYSAPPIREWSEHDPTMIREWSDHEPVSPAFFYSTILLLS